jgi:hypothetical protein
MIVSLHPLTYSSQEPPMLSILLKIVEPAIISLTNRSGISSVDLASSIGMVVRN